MLSSIFPIGQVKRHQASEKLPMVLNAQVQQFMHDDVFLEILTLSQEVFTEGHGPVWGARSPLLLHPLHPDLGRFDVERTRPSANSFLEDVFVREPAFLLGHDMEQIG